MRYGWIVLWLWAFGTAAGAVEFSTERASEGELATVQLMEALRRAHDLEKWELTDKIHVDERAIPHSHPVLTLSTRHTRRDQTDLLLATYLHEQLHWHVNQHPERTAAAVEELRGLFEEVPVGYPEGGKDTHSTYVHLLVCYLEMAAVGELLSAERVERVLTFWQGDHYTWIYDQVAARGDDIGQVITRHGLHLD